MRLVVTAEEEAAEYIQSNVTKPVVGYIAGVTAPLRVSVWVMRVQLFQVVRAHGREKFAAFERAGMA